MKTTLCLTLCAVALLAGSGLRAANVPTWTPTGNLNTPRYAHTATLLANGQVLLVGGSDYDPVAEHWSTTGDLSDNDTLNSSELYDPATGTFSTTGSLHTARTGHTATLLYSGKVLVAGGVGPDPGTPKSAELYDPATGMWTPTGSLAGPHDGHTATLLPNGKVLVVGKVGTWDPSSSAELYDPTAGTWASAGTPTWARYAHTATLLQNGSVLIAGGVVGDYDPDIEWPAPSNAEVYDPASGSWRIVGDPMIHFASTATLLSDGKVLVAGGMLGCAGADLFDPVAEHWSFTGDLIAAHLGHTATLLPDGKVLVAGGGRREDSLVAWGGLRGNAGKLEELYDPVETGTWASTSQLHDAGRFLHTATLLSNGNVLVAGGNVQSNGIFTVLSSAELYGTANLEPCDKNHYILGRPCEVPPK